ncbi:hypothetical protein IPN35_04590 [Candidatus Peregrinibacteria bacterium]|nr:MAG: hypothetical protein IPN35_04590 [Candidatus Peregrinibacteria bacterium]
MEKEDEEKQGMSEEETPTEEAVQKDSTAERIVVSFENPTSSLSKDSYQLQQYEKDSGKWSYTASRRYNNLDDGLNVYTITAYRSDGEPSVMKVLLFNGYQEEEMTTVNFPLFQNDDSITAQEIEEIPDVGGITDLVLERNPLSYWHTHTPLQEEGHSFFILEKTGEQLNYSKAYLFRFEEKNYFLTIELDANISGDLQEKNEQFKTDSRENLLPVEYQEKIAQFERILSQKQSGDEGVVEVEVSEETIALVQELKETGNILGQQWHEWCPLNPEVCPCTKETEEKGIACMKSRNVIANPACNEENQVGVFWDHKVTEIETINICKKRRYGIIHAHDLGERKKVLYETCIERDKDRKCLWYSTRLLSTVEPFEETVFIKKAAQPVLANAHDLGDWKKILYEICIEKDINRECLGYSTRILTVEPFEETVLVEKTKRMILKKNIVIYTPSIIHTKNEDFLLVSTPQGDSEIYEVSIILYSFQKKYFLVAYQYKAGCLDYDENLNPGCPYEIYYNSSSSKAPYYYYSGDYNIEDGGKFCFFPNTIYNTTKEEYEEMLQKIPDQYPDFPDRMPCETTPEGGYFDFRTNTLFLPENESTI